MDGFDCVLCPQNKIKYSPGDAKSCDLDCACDGKFKVPNAEHTACGKILVITLNVDIQKFTLPVGHNI